MTDNREPTGAEKLQFVAEQMASHLAGQRPVIDCPYCLGQSRRGEPFCCATMMRAFEAILDADDQLRIAQFMDRVIDRHMSN